MVKMDYVKMDYYNTVNLISITMKIAKIMQHDAIFILHDEVEHYFLRELSTEEKDLIEQLENSSEIYLINILYNIANEVYDRRIGIEKDGISSIFFNSKKKNDYKLSLIYDYPTILYTDEEEGDLTAEGYQILQRMLDIAGN